MTPEQIAEAKRLLETTMADIPGNETDKQIDLLLHKRTVAERTFMMNFAPALLGEVERLREELGQLRLDDEVEQRATALSPSDFDEPF